MSMAKVWLILQVMACSSVFAQEGASPSAYMQLARREINGQSLEVSGGGGGILPNSSELRVLVGLTVPIENSALGVRAAVGGAHFEARFGGGKMGVSSIPVEFGLYGRIIPGLRLGGSVLTHLYQHVEADKAGTTTSLHARPTMGVLLYGEYEVAKGANLLAGYTHDRLRAEGSGLGYRASVDSFQLAASYRFR